MDDFQLIGEAAKQLERMILGVKLKNRLFRALRRFFNEQLNIISGSWA